jgi:hypothetical protein
MEIPQLSVKSLANHLTIAHNHCSDKRIRANSTPSALRKLKRPREVRSIRACELRFHTTD